LTSLAYPELTFSRNTDGVSCKGGLLRAFQNGSKLNAWLRRSSLETVCPHAEHLSANRCFAPFWNALLKGRITGTNRIRNSQKADFRLVL
jgi:hypothetical protein